MIPLKSGFGYLLNQNLKKTIHSNYAALNHHVFEYVQNLFEIKRSFFNALAMIFNFSKLP